MDKDSKLLAEAYNSKVKVPAEPLEEDHYTNTIWDCGRVNGKIVCTTEISDLTEGGTNKHPKDPWGRPIPQKGVTNKDQEGEITHWVIQTYSPVGTDTILEIFND